jgi:hypothetical protein
MFQQVQDLYTAAYNTGDPVLVCYELANEHVHFSPEELGTRLWLVLKYQKESE